ncbi:RNA polymerase sigma factor sigA isoform X2 [Cryptomeria japonica]|uniref:RNA polymerase sigma factor sigA isoform X2 n=1 Tax=Cryptomeria japonica TaxID=3369 RepID=UPI0027DA3DC4|nr:RNA polymerase sigma factor sigA isoform X2 [Cryptomeria japonica]
MLFVENYSAIPGITFPFFFCYFQTYTIGCRVERLYFSSVKRRNPQMNIGGVIRISAGKQLLQSSFLLSESAAFLDQGSVLFTTSVWKHVVLAKKSSNSRAQNKSAKHIQIKALNALREVGDGFSISSANEAPSTISTVMDENSGLAPEVERSLEALILLQKSMLEKQWYLNLYPTEFREFGFWKSHGRSEVVRSGKASARQRRQNARRKSSTENFVKSEHITQIADQSNQERVAVQIGSLRETVATSMKSMLSQKLLTHEEVLHLSSKIQIGITLRKHRSRLKTKLGYEPSNAQWAASMGIPVMHLNRKLMESYIAAQKMVACNIRLVVSIAQKYENTGVDIRDLIQEGLIGLRHGIDKFDSSKGFKLSTYVYWWIRQGITRALVDYKRTVRIPNHVHERLALIRKAKLTLQENGVTSSVKNIAATLNMSEKKVKNATQAIKRVYSFDKEYCVFENNKAQTFHSRIADPNSENYPWLMVDGFSLKEDVHKLINSTLTNREQVIIKLYFGLDTQRHTWEDVSKRERVRQIGRISLGKLKQATRRHKLQPPF